ncbi:hypothetical protein PICMEDRAFT_116594 [Pichia membranifaciens NRRL Y-2026]|uniref:Uncharacterized protein n=1 Tax=Pichia membranifaciens NRRL Y-2026 TaxID=763406 RepID=A0A1E3NND9_9ASCO|nr:hypothetical protein PICMEDRAFT_116594 [Pichia membranifaciens NRRL Y-2026]ODQ47611.1 hypothetical protein PICMEDRAFT_116594 [Pichia membranifaciens NRRL Y-2026]
MSVLPRSPETGAAAACLLPACLSSCLPVCSPFSISVRASLHTPSTRPRYGAIAPQTPRPPPPPLPLAGKQKQNVARLSTFLVCLLRLGRAQRFGGTAESHQDGTRGHRASF